MQLRRLRASAARRLRLHRYFLEADASTDDEDVPRHDLRDVSDSAASGMVSPSAYAVLECRRVCGVLGLVDKVGIYEVLIMRVSNPNSFRDNRRLNSRG